MEYQKITNLLDTTSDNVPRFITKKWVEVHDQSCSTKDKYKPSKQIRFKTSMLRSDLRDFNDAYIVVKGTITLTKTDGRGFIDIKNSFLAFKNNAPFINCISKINNVLIDNAEDLDVVMPIYNLLEYNKKYKKQREVCGIITGMSLIILLLMMKTLLLLIIIQILWRILSLSNTKVVLQEKHQMQIKKTV